MIKMDSPVETEGMVPRLHRAVHFQALKAVIQNNSYNTNNYVSTQGDYSNKYSMKAICKTFILVQTILNTYTLYIFSLKMFY